MDIDTNPMRFGSGQAVRRIEDEGLLCGRGQFTDDVAAPGLAWACFVRSPQAHALITAVDSAAAQTMPGVLQVLTGAQLVQAGVLPMPAPANFKRADGSAAAAPVRHMLATDRVRFVGEAVAVVVAASLQQARDAAEAVQVQYQELPMVVDIAAAMAPGAPVICEAAPDNISAAMRHGDVAATAAAFAQARHVVRLALRNQRVAAVTLEPRSVLVSPEPGSGRLIMRLSTQMPSGVRNAVCDALGLARDHVRVVVGDVGGGFGMKTGAYPEDIVLVHCARTLARPVKWVADRGEEFTSSFHVGTSRARPNWPWRRTAGSWRCAWPRRPTSGPTRTAPGSPSSC